MLADVPFILCRGPQVKRKSNNLPKYLISI